MKRFCWLERFYRLITRGEVVGQQYDLSWVTDSLCITYCLCPLQPFTSTNVIDLSLLVYRFFYRFRLIGRWFYSHQEISNIHCCYGKTKWPIFLGNWQCRSRDSDVANTFFRGYDSDDAMLLLIPPLPVSVSFRGFLFFFIYLFI